MNFRYSDSYQAQPEPEVQATTRTPNERRILNGLLIGFLVVSIIVLLAGRIPGAPTVTPLPGPTAADFQAEARTLLGSYGNTLDGKIHIPISQAIDLIAQRGLPTRDNPSPTP
jgi:hypothetical protein